MLYPCIQAKYLMLRSIARRPVRMLGVAAPWMTLFFHHGTDIAFCDTVGSPQ